MTDLTCSDARDLAPEVAAGVASAEERARVLAHVGTCANCSALLRELSALVDDIVALAPRHEPPAGFESDVQARLDELDAAGRGQLRRAVRPRRMRRLVLVAAAIVGAAGLSGLAVYQGHRVDRTLADQIRGTLAQANGEYFAAAPLEEPDGLRRGVVFAYQGDPAWMFLTVDGGLALEEVSVVLVTHDGTARTIGEGLVISPRVPWGMVIPVAVHDVAVVRVVDGAGELILSARVVP